MKLRGFLASQALTNVATLLGDVCGFLYYAFAIGFPPDLFAAVQSVTALLFFITTSATVISTFIVMRSKQHPSMFALTEEGMRLGMSAVLIIAAFFVGTAPLLAHFLHIPTLTPFLLLAACSGPFILTGVLQGINVAQRRFLPLAITIFTLNAARVPFAFLFFGDGFDQNDAPLVLLASGLVALAVTILMDGRVLKPHMFVPVLPSREDALALAQLLVSIFVTGIILKFDILWAKHELAPGTAGIYGTASLAASVLFFISAGVGRASAGYITPSNMHRIVFWSLAMILGGSFLGVLGYFIIGEKILYMLMTHGQELPRVPQLFLFLAMTGYAVIVFCVQCLGVLHRTVHTKLMSLLVMTDVLALIFFGHSMISIAVVQAIVLSAFAIAAVVLLLRHVVIQAR